METKDPSLWSVNDVRQWAESTFEFADTLATSLVDNDVDGPVLLEHVNDDTLKTDVGVTSLGQRVKIIEKIRELRDRSRMFWVCLV
jgi:SAM domain (Sterile alpha motif)